MIYQCNCSLKAIDEFVYKTSYWRCNGDYFASGLLVMFWRAWFQYIFYFMIYVDSRAIKFMGTHPWPTIGFVCDARKKSIYCVYSSLGCSNLTRLLDVPKLSPLAIPGWMTVNYMPPTKLFLCSYFYVSLASPVFPREEVLILLGLASLAKICVWHRLVPNRHLMPIFVCARSFLPCDMYCRMDQ